MEITKRSGSVVLFETGKIAKSILKANEGAFFEEITPAHAEMIADDVFRQLSKETSIITTRDVHLRVYDILLEKGFRDTAALYRKRADEQAAEYAAKNKG